MCVGGGGGGGGGAGRFPGCVLLGAVPVLQLKRWPKNSWSVRDEKRCVTCQ